MGLCARKPDFVASEQQSALGTDPVLDKGFISIASLGPRASTKVESSLNLNESQKV